MLLPLISLAPAASHCLGADQDNGDPGNDRDAVVAEADDAPKEQAAEAEPPRPEPVGKLGIRKGTGRPAGQRLAEPRGDIIEDVEMGMVPVLGQQRPRAALNPALEEQIENTRKQLDAQLRPILHAEIYFIHLVCDTNAQERQQLLAAAEPEFEKVAITAARRLVTAGDMAMGAIIMRGGAVGGRGAAASNREIEPQKMLRESLIRVAAAELGEDRASQLREEMKQRVESQRRATIGNIISRLDDFLVLSPEQQEALREPMLAGWREEWQLIPQQVHPQYFPEMQFPPAALQVLSANQRKRWGAVPKIHFGNQPNALLRGLPRAEQGDRWKAALERLDKAERNGETNP